jgi:hypothetical protein
VRRTPPDPALPALQELLGGNGAPDHVTEAAQELAGASLRLPGELEYVRYRPTKSCIALWSFRRPDGRRVLLSGALLGETGRPVVADAAFRRLAEEARAVADAARAYRWLPRRRLLLQLFPLDAVLPGLPMAVAAEEVRRALSASGALDGQAGRAEVTPLSYKPWRRCVLRYRFETSGGEAAFIGKVYRDGRGEAMHRWLELVRAHLVAADAPCDVVAPALYLPDARLLLLEAVAGGTELARLLDQSADGDAGAREALLTHVARAAEVLPAFRRALVPGVPHMGPAAVLSQLERRARGLDRVVPALADSVARRLRDLEAEAARLRPEPLGLAHGAFRHNQLLAAGDRLILLDLDTLCVGGAGTDPGGFLAYLDGTSLRRPRLRAVLSDCEEAFVAIVEAHASSSASWLAWHRAAGHVKWALRSVLALAPSWPETADALLRLAGRTLAGPPSRATTLRRSVA